MAKMKHLIRKIRPEESVNYRKPCVACAGTGYYDWTNRWGRQPKCAACDGSGEEKPDS